MVTPTATMAVVRAARPVLRCAHDGIAFAADTVFLANRYSLCAVGPAALTAPLPAEQEEVGIDGWNTMDNCYAFLYSKEEEGKKKCILMKCVVIDDFLAIDALDLEAYHKEPFHVQINVKDFFSEDQPNTYKDMYKNFTGFVCILNSSLLVELDGKDPVAAQNPDVERSWSINSFENILWENLSIRTSEPASFGNVMWENLSTRTIEPAGSPSSSENVLWENLSIRTTEPVCSGNIMFEKLSTRTIEPVGSPSSPENILWKNMSIRTIEPASSEIVLWKNLSIRTTEPTCSGNVMRKNLSTRTTEPASSGNILLENLIKRTIEPVGSPSSPENIMWKNMSIRTIESASSENVLWENLSIRSTEPTSLTYPPVVLFGHDDTFPAPGAGFYPHSGGTGGSMHIGPNYPCFFPSNPSTPFGDLGSVPPGGRYDPIGPPDVPGFEPSLSEAFEAFKAFRWKH